MPNRDFVHKDTRMPKYRIETTERLATPSDL